MSGLFEPDDSVAVRAVRADRVLPDDIYWGIEMSAGQPRKGFLLEAEAVPVPLGAVPVSPGKVRLASFIVDADSLVLIQDLRR